MEYGWIFVIIATLCTTGSAKHLKAAVNVSEDVNATEVFVCHFSPSIFDWTSEELEHNFHFTSVVLEDNWSGWLYTKTFKEGNKISVYGAPPTRELENFKLEVQITITNLHSYRSELAKLNVNVVPKPEPASRAVHFHIKNVGIEEFLEEKRQKDLLEIIENDFWPESKGKLYYTFIASDEDVGFRLPAKPNATSGVVVHIGSSVEFSKPLIDLKNELNPLSKHCPTFSKRVTVERFFRAKNFTMDWCMYKLVNCSTPSQPFDSETAVTEIPEIKYPEKEHVVLAETTITVATSSKPCRANWRGNASGTLKKDIEKMVNKTNVPKKEYFRTAVLLTFLPCILLTLILLGWIGWMLCVNGRRLEKLEKYEFK